MSGRNVPSCCCSCCFLHINRSGLNHTQYYTWLPIRYVVCWAERDQRNIYQAPMRAKEKHKHTKNDKEKGTGIIKINLKASVIDLLKFNLYGPVPLKRCSDTCGLLVGILSSRVPKFRFDGLTSDFCARCLQRTQQGDLSARCCHFLLNNTQ